MHPRFEVILVLTDLIYILKMELIPEFQYIILPVDTMNQCPEFSFC